MTAEYMLSVAAKLREDAARYADIYAAGGHYWYDVEAWERREAAAAWEISAERQSV